MTLPARVDVAIVGAGPAGTSTALWLARACPGLRTIVVERARLPRDKPCGGAISRWGLEQLARLDLDLDRLRVERMPIAAIRVRHGDVAMEHDVGNGERLGAVVQRSRFDHALAREAVARGVPVFDRTRLIALERTPRGHRLRFEHDQESCEVEARFVVGADGTGSAVRRLANIAEAGPRARLCVLETEKSAHDDVDRGEAGVLEFDLGCVDRGIAGYLWNFATTFDGVRCVSRGIYQHRGLCDVDVRAMRSVLDDALRARGVAIEGARFKSYTERVFVPGTLVADRSGVLLVGEAAGLVDPVTGEGIAQALASGATCADEIARATMLGSVDPERYARAIASLRFHRHLRQTARLAPHVYGPRARTFARALASSKAAVDAGARWYAGDRLGLPRKGRVGAAFAWQLLRAGARAAQEYAPR